MEQRISLVTLGVADLDRAVRFYEALGWRGQVVAGTAFFQAGGMALVLWSRDLLAADVGITSAAPVERSRPGGERSDEPGFAGVTLAQNVRTPEEVDEIVARAEAAGARIPRRPAPTFYGGYAGYFLDPDGHAWEIAHNPGFTLDAEGGLRLPDFGADG